MRFSETVWEKTRLVPRGKVTTYSEIARAIGRPKAARAVGNALNSNPCWPEVPCHRVVKSTGELGGFARGSAEKKALLKGEGIGISGQKVTNLKGIMHYF